MDKVITDREIQIARQRAREGGRTVSGDGGDVALVEMLQQLLDYRRISREVVTKHDYRAHHNKSMSYLDSLVGQSGCQWFQCTAEAKTHRMRNEAHSRGEASCVCCKHADEGEEKGLWDMQHPMSIEWKQSDMSMREWARKRDEERAREEVSHGA
jgi:phage/plasmid primase-like uncharacterized protein